MNFAVILAGGHGSRIRSSKIPKQFLNIGGSPILQLTVDKFLNCPNIDAVVVGLPALWISHAKDILNKPHHKDVLFCEGGNTRQDTLYKALQYICKNFKISESDVAVSHDAARPFVSYRIIEDNIRFMSDYDALDTLLPSSDTIVCSEDGQIISSIPDRSSMYLGQTPQSFRILDFMQVYENMSQEYLARMTDAIRILTEHGRTVGIVKGEPYNIKITNDEDLHLSRFILESQND